MNDSNYTFSIGGGEPTLDDPFGGPTQKKPFLGLGTAVNSQQEWNGAGKRPSLSTLGTSTQISHLEREQAGLPPIGAPPGTDIRSAADRVDGPVLGGKMDSEADWRAVFGAKKMPGEVAPAFALAGTPAQQKHRLGMGSVMAAMDFQHSLLQSLGVNPQATNRTASSTSAVTNRQNRAQFGVIA